MKVEFGEARFLLNDDECQGLLSKANTSWVLVFVFDTRGDI